MVATPGSMPRCRLSVMVQLYSQVHHAYQLPRHVFVPAPKVDATVVRLIPKPMSEMPTAPFKLVERVVRAIFFSRRKIIWNNIRRLIPDPADSDAALEAAGVARSERSTALSSEQIQALISWAEMHPERLAR